MYHRFSTDVAVPAFEVTEGTVVHAAPCMRCEQPSVARRVTRVDDQYGEAVEIAVGCWCGTKAQFTMRREHVLTLAGVVALL